MYFFTTYYAPYSQYCLLPVNHYYHPSKLSKKLIFLDPQVYTLNTHTEYPKIQFLHDLAKGQLLPNEYMSIDYPPDMQPSMSDVFIERTIRNNIQYQNNSHYICTIQFPIQKYVYAQKKIIAKPTIDDFIAFKRNYEYLAPIFEHKQKILGIGNCCRIQGTNEFTDAMMSFLYDRLDKLYWIHFYGINLSMIKTYLPDMDKKIIISCDSTKWTYAHSQELKEKYRGSCYQTCRQEYFDSYLHKIPNVIF